MSESKGWYGVDLDGTLAFYDAKTHGKDWDHIGAPILPIVRQVLELLDRGENVRIFTARLSDVGEGNAEHMREVIQAWCFKHLGHMLPVTNVKDFGMIQLIDDRCLHVETNTGRVLG